MSEYPYRSITFYALLHWSPVYAISHISISLTPLYLVYHHEWFINRPFIFSLFVSQWPNNSLPATGLVPGLLRLSWMRWSASAPCLRKLKLNGEFQEQKILQPQGRVRWWSLLTTQAMASNRQGQSFTGMCLPISNSIPKILGQIQYPTYVTSRSSVKHIYRKNQLQNCSRISFT